MAIDLDKARGLVVAFREHHEKAGRLLEELEALLGGKAGIGTLLKAAQAHYGAAWSQRYGSAYVWAYAKDGAQLKRLIQALGVVEVNARATRYLANNDPFFATRRHPFGLFVGSIGQHVAPADAAFELEEDGARPTGCRHTPACKTDTEHTRRRSADMREGSAF